MCLLMTATILSPACAGGHSELRAGSPRLCRPAMRGTFLLIICGRPAAPRMISVFIVVGLVKPPVPVLRRAALMRTRSQDDLRLPKKQVGAGVRASSQNCRSKAIKVLIFE